MFLFSLPVTNYNLLIILFYRAKVVNSTRLYSPGSSRLLEPKQGSRSPAEGERHEVLN